MFRKTAFFICIVFFLLFFIGCASAPKEDAENLEGENEQEAVTEEPTEPVEDVAETANAADTADNADTAAAYDNSVNESESEGVEPTKEDAQEVPEIVPYDFPEVPSRDVDSERTYEYPIIEPIYIPAKKEIPKSLLPFIRGINILSKAKKLILTRLGELHEKEITDFQRTKNELETSLNVLKNQNGQLAEQNAILEKEIFQLQEELLAALQQTSTESAVEEKETVAAVESEEPKAQKTEYGPDRGDELRHVYAVPHDVIGVTLNGNGWIYLGEDTNAKGIVFKARDNTEKYTEFIFETKEIGEYYLQFRRQDLFTGEDLFQTIHASVVTSDKFEEMLNFAKETTGASRDMVTPSPKGFILADTYYNEERYEDALREYLKNYVEGNDRINQRIAELSFLEEDYEQAERFWRKNRYSDKITYQEQAIKGLIRTAIRRDDAGLFDELSPEVSTLQRVPIREVLHEMITYQMNRNKINPAVALLEEYVTRYYGDSDADWAYYTLGTLHEKSGPVRDLQKAKHYYRVVIQDFPASSYYDKAEERIQYIDKNFIHLQ